jgi:hypothetical protein
VSLVISDTLGLLLRGRDTMLACPCLLAWWWVEGKTSAVQTIVVILVMLEWTDIPWSSSVRGTCLVSG